MSQEKDKKVEARQEGRSVEYWVQEIKDAQKREKDYRKEAKEIIKLYENEKKEQHPYNILYSNTETLQSALYNQLPRPEVQRRFQDKDPVGKLASESISRFLEFFMDSNDRDYSNFDALIETSVEEALVPGRGLTRFKVDALITQGEGGTQVVTSASVCGEEVPWDRISYGYAKSWSNIPWLAFDHFMSKEELIQNFGTEWAARIPLDVMKKEDSDRMEESNSPEDLGDVRLAHVCEIWDKETKMVIFIAPSYKDAVIKEIPDPLKLSGFFPVPRPLYFKRKFSSLIPIPVYSYYEEQAKELNRITVRINRIVRALKVRGFYDASLDGIKKVLEAEDNTLLPAENVAALQDGRTLEKSIWLMPIEKLVAVLQQLYLQREQVKVIIQELTGIADIMRGSTRASETLGAQEIKAQWGGLRLQTMRKRVQLYVRDCLRIVAEIGFKHLPADLLHQMVNLPIPTQEEKAQLAQQYQAQVQAAQQQAMMTGQPPAPSPPPPLLQLPSWEEVIQLCQDDILRNFKIDIETDSTVEADSAQERADMGEFLNAIAQFLNGALPLTQSGVLPFEVMKSIMGAVVRRYRFGREVEESLEQMQAPPPPVDPKAETDKAKGEAEAQKLKLEIQSMQQKMQADTTKLQLEARIAGQEAQLREFDAQQKLRELQRKEELAIQSHQAKLLQLQIKTASMAADAEAKREMNEISKAKSEEASDASA